MSDDIIYKKFISLNSNVISNKDMLTNTNPIKFKTNLNVRSIKCITEIELIPFFIPVIDGMTNSDKIYITLSELVYDNDFTDFHFICKIKKIDDAFMITPCNKLCFHDDIHRFRSNILSFSFKLYDFTEIPIVYSFPNNLHSDHLLFNYMNEKKINMEIQISYKQF